jgi:3-hydroxymyristoyl/3-hydroxydecanoyl-(acyl carrier protein) dehydratase
VERSAGKINPRNCVITPLERAEEPRTWRGSVIIERDDPTFFDHPLDHVPGLLLIEAMKQAAVAAVCHEDGLDHTQVVPWTLHCKFSRVAEFRPDVTCLAELEADGTSASLRCEQDGKKLCTATVGLARV